MVVGLFSINELDFLLDLGLSLLAGFLIGLERELKGKPAGIGTHCFVIGGSMIYLYFCFSRSKFYLKNCCTDRYWYRIS